MGTSTKISNSRIKKLANVKTIAVDSLIVHRKSIISNSKIKKLSNQKTKNSNSFIKKSANLKTKNSNSRIKKITPKNVNSNSYIDVSGEYSGNITYISDSSLHDLMMILKQSGIKPHSISDMFYDSVSGEYIIICL